MKLFSFLFVMFLPISMSAQNIAQKDSLDYLVDDVVVTATRNKRLVNSLPVPSMLITKEVIQQKNITNLSDLLQEIAGVTTVTDFGGSEGIQMQGIDSEYVLILLDGAPLIGRSAGTFDLNRISLQQVEQVEIVKGASSSLYGNEALGGVVNIITKQPDQQQLELSTKYETNNSLDAFIGYRNSFNKTGLLANIRHFQTDGFTQNDNGFTSSQVPYNNQEVNVTVSHPITTTTDLRIRGRYFSQIGEDVFIEDEQFTNEWNSQLSVKHRFTDKLTTEVDVATTRFTLNYQNDPSIYNEFFMQPELRSTYYLKDDHLFLFGTGFRNEELERSSFSTTPTLNSQYGYIQYDGFFFNDRLNLVAGTRFDNHQQYESRLSPKLSARYEFSDQISSRFSIGTGFKRPDFRQLYFDFSNPAAFYMVLGTEEVSNKVNEFKEQGYHVIATNGADLDNYNKMLSPESSLNVNLGVLFNDDKVQFEVNAFYNELSNLINSYQAGFVVNNNSSTPTNTQLFSYENISEVITKGVEIHSNINLIKENKISIGYQFLLTEDVEAKDRFDQGNAFIRDPITLQSRRISSNEYFGLFNRSKHMANLSVFQKIPILKSDANIRLVYRSKYGLSDTNANGALDSFDEFVSGYPILDVAYNYQLNDTIKIGLGADNVINYKDIQNIPSLMGALYSGNLFIQF